ncbi:MAG TPA: T9SS type A sorting domain-containing protein, partial [Bacteroidales bacterium]|nr:T9SS type A sorting domain-containing protein [Bacteroidales bacterium]
INLGPPIDWMSIDPLVGQVIIGEIDTILISFNTNGMEMGIYECMLRIYSVADTISLPVTLHVDMGVGREDVFLSSALQVYPNPSVDVFTIYSDAKLGELHYEITDISGRSLWNTNSSESLLQWNPASDVASGVYFLTVKNSSMQITQKIILNK